MASIKNNISILFFVLICISATASDWPTWRYDAGRSAYTQTALPEALRLQWRQELPEPKGAWPKQKTVLEHESYTYEFYDDEDKLQFDVSYTPVAAGGRLFVPSMICDALLAYDMDTGVELWRYVVDGPVRFAPVVHKEHVYFVSDDGYLYCITAEDGTLVWRFRGGPSDRMILGNERFIDTWPARGAPAIVEDTIYFAAGIWPFMGIFIHALDAQTGDIVWTNSSSGAVFDQHQHGGAYAFGGVAPHGHIAVNGDVLLVAGGLTVPAVYDRLTGDFLYYRQSSNMVGKGAGGHAVYTQGDWFFNHDVMYSLEDGAQFGPLPASVLTGDEIIGVSRGRLKAHDAQPEVREVEITDRLEGQAIRKQYSMKETWRASVPEEFEKLFLRAGDLYYMASVDGAIAALRVDPGKEEATVVWHEQVAGPVWTMLVADDKLIVVTESGRIYCYGENGSDKREYPLKPSALPPSTEMQRSQASAILKKAGISEGYAQFWGLGDAGLLYALLENSNLHILAIDPDEQKVSKVRRILADADLYGRRVSVVAGTAPTMTLPPYISSLIVVGDVAAAGFSSGTVFTEKLFHCLRPYGGVACIPISSAEHKKFSVLVEQAKLPNASVERLDGLTILRREGALPGAGQWTHEHATSANIVMSDDDLVKAPLGILWFGGPTNENVLPRHGYGPVPQVCDGRLFILGVNGLNARDVYSGRLLWHKDFPGIGDPYQTLPDGPGKYLAHQPGAAFYGSRYVSSTDGEYVAYKDTVLHLDPATGTQLNLFTLNATELELPKTDLVDLTWGYIGLWDNMLILGAGPQIFDEQAPGARDSFNATSSQCLVVMNRYTGEILWRKIAKYGFRHNAIVTENETVFAIDGLSEGALDLMKRRGIELDDAASTLYALDARSGAIKWRQDEGVFGTWLGYSKEHDLLVQAGRGQRGGAHGLPDEPDDRIKVHNGSDGTLMWEHTGPYQGPLALHSDRIIPSCPSRGVSAPALDILTGENCMRTHPITGKETAWHFKRTYGCGTGITSKHLLTFRSGAAGFYDLCNDGGTGNFGGFRASCTNNLVVADGILNAPDYTRTCQCAYQNRTSLAMVHTPEVEVWTYSAIPASREPVQRVGVNLGAPGDRLDGKTLWLDFPSVGGDSPDIPISFSNETVDWFRMHSSLFSAEGGGPAWVGASGLEGEGRLEITVASGEDIKEQQYTINLYFAEPELSATDTNRVFDVAIQGETKLSAFCPFTEAGGIRKTVMRSFSEIRASDRISIALTSTSVTELLPVLSGVEVILE